LCSNQAKSPLSYNPHTIIIHNIPLKGYLGDIIKKTLHLNHRDEDERMEIYDFIRIGIIIFIISLLIVFMMLVKQKQGVTGFTLLITTAISIFGSAIHLIVIGYISDELGIAGDVVSFNMFLIVLILSIVNVMTYFKRNKV
jgi:uncharacterized membrane protein